MLDCRERSLGIVVALGERVHASDALCEHLSHLLATLEKLLPLLRLLEPRSFVVLRAHLGALGRDRQIDCRLGRLRTLILNAHVLRRPLRSKQKLLPLCALALKRQCESVGLSRLL